MNTVTRPVVPRARRKNRGFTLIEMLIVGALITLFSGLAVFSISTQLDRNKQKAAVAECRQIATAMSFAQQDLTFFPKICFLRFNLPNLLSELTGPPALGFDAVEYHSHMVGNLAERLQRQWSRNGQYCGFNQDRIVKMTFSSNGADKTFWWPGDPWGNPYVAYFIHTQPGVNPGDSPTQRFVGNSGEQPNYYAGIVSYGPNHVPGLPSDASGQAVANRKPYRLYSDIATNSFRLPTETSYSVTPLSTQGLDMIRIDIQTADPDGPRIREPESDDRYLEF